jgi:YHS domain-containing protein
MNNCMNICKGFAIASFVSLAMAVGGCASSSPLAAADGSATAVNASQATSPHAECLVCKYDADLACVDVTVSNSTPSTVYDGKTYYFCSKSCCKKFEKDPTKYVNQK